jgi:hypothetical protein
LTHTVPAWMRSDMRNARPMSRVHTPAPSP